MGQCNNQPNDGFRGDGGIGEEMRMGGMCGGVFDVNLSFWGVELSDEKNRESDGAISLDGFLWMGKRNNQPKVSRHAGQRQWGEKLLQLFDHRCIGGK
jgi:hypothetical protein